MNIKERLQRKSQKDRIQQLKKQKQTIAVALRNTTSQDATLTAFLKEYDILLDEEIHFYSTAKWIGDRVARRILTNPEKSGYGKMIDVFKTGGGIVVGDLRLPIPEQADEWTMMDEFIDLLLPYLFAKNDLAFDESFYDEGPYELGNVLLEKEDVVMDCGANMGLFSAFASMKGCKVFAFEPMEYIRHTYLEKTAKMQQNIEVCPFALSDQVGEAEFQLDTDNIGASRQSEGESSCAVKMQKVKVITLDQFVRERNLERLDFIKADIEGAERHMLLGAKETIRKFSPKLAICTYHLPDDPKVLREIILSIQPRYKIVEKYKKMYAYVE